MMPTDAPTPAAAGDTTNDSGDTAPEAGAAGTERAEPAGEPAANSAADPETALAALRDRWLRTEAELQNYRRRAQRDVEETRRAAEDRALIEMIEYLDDLDRALAAAHAAGASAGWLQGVELVAQRMRDGLARAGVTAVAPAGEPFDPNLHEALLELPAPAGTAPGTVLHVERTGYRRGERVLRAARVTVAGEPAGNA